MIVVTGAGGMIGRHTCRAAGTQPFRAWLHSPDPEFCREFPQAEVVSGDLQDPEVRAHALRGIDTIVHLAQKVVDTDGAGFDRVNVQGTEALLQSCTGGLRFILISTTGVYGHGAHELADESTPVAPDSPYAQSKAAAERAVLQAHADGRVRATILRHRFVYGSGDRAVLPRIISAARKLPFLVENGRAPVSLVYGPDLGKLLWTMAGQTEPRDTDPIYHATDGEPVTYRFLVEALMAELGGSAPRHSVPFAPLYAALRLKERLLGLDPERATGLTSIRLALVARPQTFSNQRLMSRCPDFKWTALSDGLRASAAWYRGL